MRHTRSPHNHTSTATQLEQSPALGASAVALSSAPPPHSNVASAMSHIFHNPTFKRPKHPPPLRLRSISPPRDFVEPLSPSKPTPIEPSFNYPAINSHIDFAVRPDSAYTTPSKASRARTYSAGHKGGHQRTPSTIDTLAEAALAASPSYSSHSRHHSTAFETTGHTHAHPLQHPPASGEPPHKRARSELLPSPFIPQYTSRPATSYEPSNGWTNPPELGHEYNSRVEEAALLLNFQSGGWPAHAGSLPIPPAPASRPHANSFPQDAFHVRPLEVIAQPQSTLLPPFAPQDAHQPPPTLPSPQKTIDDVGPSPKARTDVDGDVEMRDVHVHLPPKETSNDTAPQTQTPPDEMDSRAPSADVTISETSDAPKGRRGWPKGKPRGPRARKTMAEKAATKHTPSRRKIPDSKSARAKSEGIAADWADSQEARRKSLSDGLVFGEHDHHANEPPVFPRARSVPLDTPMVIREASPSKTGRRKTTVNSYTICAGCQTARETTNSHGELDEWISCNGCKNWFHVDCAGFKKAHEVRDVDKFFCTTCEPEHGKTTYVRKSTRAHASVDYAELQRGVLKTSEESVEHHYIQPIKDGMFQFDPETFPRMRPEMVTRDFFEKSGTFVEPICIPAEWNPRPWMKSTNRNGEDSAGAGSLGGDEGMAGPALEEFEYDTVPDHGQDKLEMVMPQGLTVRQVCNLVGSDMPIDVIDVKTQNSGAKWTLSRWADYYDEVGDEKPIRNVISLEVSQTKLGRLLQRPKIVRDIDLQDDVWPQEEIDKGKFPKVQFYCLMSIADSYTDFHIDFGGSSVYYHILKGKKTFFFIPPTAKHLKAYEQWNDSPQQNFTFLPSITKECYRVDLSEGDTMLIPSGWIHAVWTPADSLVIGGNFLNRMSYKNQFRVVEIEKINETPMKFRYPFFQKIMWYTAIKYLKDDPLPPAVSQLFYEGRRFDREVPVWGDFDGDIANNDPRPGAQNARFYSQAEMEGLPELVNFIFRTVMLVMGRIEGTTAERMKRVNASIPKGYGEPLEIAKTFALWVAWKRGNEDPPQWAHPDAVLPSSKDEGPPKKLSERKLKELERKEAIAAWRVAPDRQSVRVMTKNANAAATASVSAAASDENSSPASAQLQNHQMHTPYYQNHAYGPAQASATAPPAAFLMQNIPGQHLSTPKTSVLGPKRVACDACRKRRIRCKHKDMVLQTTPNGVSQFDGANAAIPSKLAPDWHDNITVTPPKQREHMNFMTTVMDGQASGGPAHEGDGDSFAHDGQHLNSQGPQPGTNAYVNANIPMTMNGVPIFGDVPKRGRSKACYECRKSKRRCIHDENGNVDPVKASETPVPRGSMPGKKRQSTEEGSPLLISKKPRLSDAGDAYSHSPIQQAPLMQGHGVLKPQNMSYKPQKRPNTTAQAQAHVQRHAPEQQPEQEEQPPIDPNLFSMYAEAEDGAAYSDNHYHYSTNEQAQNYNLLSQSYNMPSLEQIANEVLVDMNGNEYQESSVNAPHLPNGHSKPEESVDSAVSLPNTEASEQRTTKAAESNAEEVHKTEEDIESRLFNALGQHDLPPARQSIETNGAQLLHENTSPERPKSGASNLPLYQPPAPLSQSPDAVKRQPVIPNGIGHGKSSSPAEATSAKRNRESNSATPGAKKLRVDAVERQSSRDGEGKTEDEKQSIELAKVLQQQDLGLRRRSK